MSIATVTSAIARFRVPGFHKWNAAPEGREYLRARHRHLFHIEVSVDVEHGDREVEIHDLRTHALLALDGFLVKGWRDDLYYDFGGRSCEHLAEHIATYLPKYFDGIYEQRRIAVSVLEDGEAGGSYIVSPQNVAA